MKKQQKMTTRRDFLNMAGACAGAAGLLGQSATSAAASIGSGADSRTRPNILFIILEDWGPYLGCYGEKEMYTPNLDGLAAEGVRFDLCFTSGPVCSAGRSSLMTGVSQYTVHAHQHRTPVPKPSLPAGIKTVPEIFRDAGYYTALGCGYSSKIDLNFDFRTSEIFQDNDWSKRKPGQPFFAHLSLLGTHRAWKGDPDRRIDPAKVTLPRWYPDTPMTRKDWAMGLESAQVSDRLFGDIVARLKSEGIYDQTAIVITADHGVALPRAKQFLYDDGLHIPLIIRAPGRAKAGTLRRELISNVDVVPTMLGMAGLPAPAYLQGNDLLDRASAPRRYVFAGRDRMDDTHDAMRAVRSKEFKYILNLMPERAYCQFNNYKETSYPGLALLNVLHMEGKLPSEQDAFMQPTKPPEELYDLRKDPHEIHNVASDPAYATELETLRTELEAWRKRVGDPGLSEEFRKGGWSPKYPTRPLEEWKRILVDWENHILHGGPKPQIAYPPEFFRETRAGEAVAGAKGGKKTKRKEKK